jgi:mono/diheme cytochrome c family protein
MMARALLGPVVLLGTSLVASMTARGQTGSPPRVESAPAGQVKFTRDVRPILARHCFACHGPDEGQRKGGLRLDQKEGAFADRDGTRPFVPGSVEESEALRRIVLDDATEKMPPGKDKRLDREQVELLKRWVEQGAEWETHWAFEKPVKHPPPEVDARGWPKNPIDCFVLARLERLGLGPSPEADKATLIRRVCLDLTGLPPTPETVDSFLRDSSPGAYERLVDRLLESPAYGERWARMWLDLARFADTKGYEKDLARTIWRYRDWVIDAFNADMPFDRFTLEQLAGDLLPGAGPEQILATAFHRNTLTNDEGGTDDEEFRSAAVKDRVDTTAQVWMGLTMGCAKCHSHKYDPIAQKEYYQFYAFFDQTADHDRFDDSPAEPFPTSEQQRRIGSLKLSIRDLEGKITAISLNLTAASGRTAEAKRTLGEIARLKKQMDAILSSVRTPIVRELPPDRRRVTKVHRRGNFLDQGEPVQPATPSFFGPWPKDAPRNRLGVALWLVSAENPLTSRVAVNRHWAQFFGRGLVETQEDFGAQGQPPSHPELLDWLACEFRDGGWSLKQLCRLIVTSATYRQSSRVSPEQFRKDRHNRLLARGPRFRLEAEMIRDSALLVSGLLSAKMHGPSVMPHQPDGIWRSTYNTAKWMLSTGEDRYRRGLYTFIKRTSAYPALTTFDAPSREVCTVRRISTNTPLQALVTLNDPAFIEAAQALARRMVREGGATSEARISHGMKVALTRSPESREIGALAALYQRRFEHYRDHPDEARRLATDPLGPLPPAWDPAELAALTSVSNVVLNLDEFLTRN